MNFKNVPSEYRPIPFWSWNEKLDTKETARQVRLMNEAGIGDKLRVLRSESNGSYYFRTVRGDGMVNSEAEIVLSDI